VKFAFIALFSNKICISRAKYRFSVTATEYSKALISSILAKVPARNGFFGLVQIGVPDLE